MHLRPGRAVRLCGQAKRGVDNISLPQDLYAMSLGDQPIKMGNLALVCGFPIIRSKNKKYIFCVAWPVTHTHTQAWQEALDSQAGSVLEEAPVGACRCMLVSESDARLRNAQESPTTEMPCPAAWSFIRSDLSRRPTSGEPRLKRGRFPRWHVVFLACVFCPCQGRGVWFWETTRRIADSALRECVVDMGS